MKLACLVCLLGSVAWAQSDPTRTDNENFEQTEVTSSDEGFSNAIRPITNPVYFDLPLPMSNIHPFFINQNMPGSISTTAGDLSLGGNFQVYAVQAEFALDETISLIAAKDGYIVFDPDSTLTSDSGFANLAAGAKWAFYYDPEDQLAVALKAIFEFPTGSRGVFQGGNYSAATPSISFIKIWDEIQVIGQVGAILPFNDSGSKEINTSWHASYNVKDFFFPLVELNTFHVVDTGNGSPRYPAQAGGAVPGIVTFEGGDLINFGASNSDQHDIVTLGFGFRVRPLDSLDVGFAFEIPLTQSNTNLMENRTTVDVVWRF
ncbi:transporter [Rubellicoccus peritrichatus]|uniref:Transporter n=1 Tax=Rubellicoccus peritrichatus TaxID=3080537 RepID=A0AAQ3QV85_9BACT|nr:transporter [Puniceicoccus sp. CR14]WOO40650.1 transporter [Puniceicoccus sp. CR14]